MASEPQESVKRRASDVRVNTIKTRKRSAELSGITEYLQMAVKMMQDCCSMENWTYWKI